MTPTAANLPFLPGHVFPNVNQKDFRKPHSLGYLNGYPIQPSPKLGIGLEKLSIDASPSPQELLERVKANPKLIYGEKQYFKKKSDSRFVPAHVAFDKVVLTFDAYFKETVHDSTEQYHLRRVRILFFLEDDSIAVVEPPVENSGIPQGVFIKRQKLPKSSNEYYQAKDFNLGINITFYGKTFRIVNCDKFTQKYLTTTEHVVLNKPEPMPVDAYQESRVRPVRRQQETAKHDKLNRFLENDRKVLRFYCIWDDTDSMFGEVREFVLHYHLVDDSIEVREVQKPNNGRDPFPILLRRQQLPKSVKELSDIVESEKYTWKDLKIGAVINVLGRPFLLRDCDEYTRRFYSENLGLEGTDLKPVSYEFPAHPKPEQLLPPYNGFGTVEDSMGSCKYLVLKPPKKDFIKMLENEHKVLRFVARMESKHKEDQDRRFVINYRLADDMMTIHEPPQRNAGIIGGKFMERTRVLKPGSALTDPQGPSYYNIEDLHVGGKIEVLSHVFVLLDADEYVFNYMEKEPERFKLSNVDKCVSKIYGLLKTLNQKQKQDLVQILKKHDPTQSQVVDRHTFVQIAKQQFPGVLKDHEIITFSRQFEQQVRRPNYVKLINSF
ncbi:hypothetical protein EDD86DRAFT_222135 [Gorgonomyces haynaldii]|nr:hypothetical protein EDD86DRAFT_222135 [Gorgonomyces haynaldii]